MKIKDIARFKEGDKVRCVNLRLPKTKFRWTVAPEMQDLITSNRYLTVRHAMDSDRLYFVEDRWGTIFHPDDFELYQPDEKPKANFFTDENCHLARATWFHPRTDIPITLYFCKSDGFWYLIHNDARFAGSIPDPTNDVDWTEYGTFAWRTYNRGWSPTLPPDEQKKNLEGYVGKIQITSKSKLTTEKKGKSVIMDLIARFKKLGRKEPQKSFIEQGITDERGELTSDGYKLFVHYLFDNKDNQTAFYNDVVKPIADSEKSEK